MLCASARGSGFSIVFHWWKWFPRLRKFISRNICVGGLIKCMAGQKSLAGLAHALVGLVRKLCSLGDISWC